MSDPTGTVMLRRSFMAEANRRLGRLRSLTHAVLVEHDMMGARNDPMAALLGEPGHRLGAFAAWFERTASEQLVGAPWWERFLERAYESGAATGGELVGRPPRSHAPVPAVYRELAAREFAGIAAAMAQQVARQAAGAAVGGRKPLPMYQRVLAVLRSVGQVRLKAAANFMVVQLHNAARLREFAAAGVTQVSVVPERPEPARPSRFLRQFMRRDHRDYNECHDPHSGEFCGPGGGGTPKEADHVKTLDDLQRFADPSLPPDTPGNYHYYHSPRHASELEAIAREGLRPDSYLSKDEIRDRGSGFVVVRTNTPLPESKDVVEVGLTYRQWKTPEKIPAGDVVRVVRAVPTGGGHTIREDELAQHALGNQGSTDPDVRALPERYRRWYRLAHRDGFADATREQIRLAAALKQIEELLAKQRAAAEAEAAKAQVEAELVRAALEKQIAAELAGAPIAPVGVAKAEAELAAAQAQAAAEIEAAKAATAAREVEAAKAWEKVMAARRAETLAGAETAKAARKAAKAAAAQAVAPPEAASEAAQVVTKAVLGAPITELPQRLLKIGSEFVNSQTAGDDLVCQECQDISDEGPYTLVEAQGILPAHPNCRCAWVPAFDMRFKVNRVLAGEQEVVTAE